jgi:tRNA pseudouridine65 synthase
VDSEAQPAAPPALDVLFQDDALLVVNKPAGLLVHRGWGGDKVVLVSLLRAHTGLGRVYPMHRLDRGTSGLVVCALTPEAARALGGALAHGDVEKRYLALVRGQPPDEGVVDHAIPRQPGGPRVPAVTRFRRLATRPAEPRTVSLVAAWPRTGRLHQIRRHLKHLSHPLIGDVRYGKGELNRAAREKYGLARLALHLQSLTLLHPVTGARLALAAPLPPDLQVPLERLGFTEADWTG